MVSLVAGSFVLVCFGLQKVQDMCIPYQRGLNSSWLMILESHVFYSPKIGIWIGYNNTHDGSLLSIMRFYVLGWRFKLLNFGLGSRLISKECCKGIVNWLMGVEEVYGNVYGRDFRACYYNPQLYHVWLLDWRLRSLKGSILPLL